MNLKGHLTALALARDIVLFEMASTMASTAQDSTAPLRGGGDKSKDEDHEEETEFSPFYGIDKGAVLQEAR